MRVAGGSNVSGGKVTYAGFWIRLVAELIDGAILVVSLWVVAWWLKSRAWSNVLDVVAAWAYYSLQESGGHMATIGKRIVEIKVTNLSGGRITLLQASARHLLKYLSAIILFIGFLMMFWDEKNRTLQDKIAGTVVVDC